MDAPSQNIPSMAPVQKAGYSRFQTPRILVALILREASSRFGKSTGGYFWSIAEPVAGIMLLSIAFGYLLAHPPIGSSFFLFYTSGVVPLLFFNATAGALAQSVAANKGLLTYPVVSVLDVIVARATLELVTYSVVFALIVTVVVRIDNINLQPDLIKIILALLLTALTGTAFGMLNCILFLYFPVWRSIWRIITRPLLIISGVMFTYDRMPPDLQHWLWFNPVLQLIGLMRGGLYQAYDDSYVSLPYLIIFCMVIIVGSGVFIRMEQSRIIQQ